MKVQHNSITGLSGGVQTDDTFDGKFRIEGDISSALAEVKHEKEVGRNKKSHYQKMCVLPPIIVLELLTKHNLDILAGDFMSEPANIRNLKYILKTEYPDLLVMT